jgi:hypothetical protein
MTEAKKSSDEKTKLQQEESAAVSPKPQPELIEAWS